jgi:hypothetical protein
LEGPVAVNSLGTSSEFISLDRQFKRANFLLDRHEVLKALFMNVLGQGLGIDLLPVKFGPFPEITDQGEPPFNVVGFGNFFDLRRFDLRRFLNANATREALGLRPALRNLQRVGHLKNLPQKFTSKIYLKNLPQKSTSKIYLKNLPQKSTST